MTKDELIDKILELEEELLDDYVYDLKGEEAAEINNNGVESQINYIFESCGEKNATKEILELINRYEG